MDWEDIYLNGKRRASEMLNQLCESAEDEILKMDVDPNRFFRERNRFDPERAFEKLIASPYKKRNFMSRFLLKLKNGLAKQVNNLIQS